MTSEITNINTAAFAERESPRDEPNPHCLDLSGDHLGVRVEVLPPNSSSSYHHYHTAEEEHVLVLEGTATLYLGDDQYDVSEGDHVCFKAGQEVAHHIENRSKAPLKFLVFGERKHNDVVFYPEGGVMLVKSAQGNNLYNYKEYAEDES